MGILKLFYLAFYGLKDRKNRACNFFAAVITLDLLIIIIPICYLLASALDKILSKQYVTYLIGFFLLVIIPSLYYCLKYYADHKMYSAEHFRENKYNVFLARITVFILLALFFIFLFFY